MRVVDRKTFLSLHEGTAYCKGKRWFFGGIEFKRDNVGSNDWYSFEPNWIESEGSHESFDILDDMLATGKSHPMIDTITRDGLFDGDALFLIFERDDLLKLRDMIDTAIAVS